MGLLIQDTFDTNFGIQLTNTYCSIRGSYTIRKSGENYAVYSNAGIWSDKNAYTNGKEQLVRGIIIEKNLSLQELTSGNMFSQLYEVLKQKLGYQHYTDDM